MNWFDRYAEEGAKISRFGIYLALALAVLVLAYSYAALGQESPRNAEASLARVTSMTPTKGVEGDRVSIVCSHVVAAKQIRFAGTDAAIVDSALLSNGELRITTLVPRNAKTGPVLVLTCDRALDAGVFVVASITTASGAGSDDAWSPGRSGSGGSGRRPTTLPPPPPGRFSEVEPDLDLPIEKPVKRQTPEPKAPPPPAAYPPVIDEPPPPSIYDKPLLSENATIVFVVDVSGSMDWDRGTYTNLEGKTVEGNRLDRAKVKLTQAVTSLPKNFEFTMLAFDCSVSYWRNFFVRADDANKNWARIWINMLTPQGGTAVGPAVASGLNLGAHKAKLVVLLGDGSPNCGAGNETGDTSCIKAHRDMIRSANAQSARIDTFGISATGSFQQFFKDVASDSGGVYTDVR